MKAFFTKYGPSLLTLIFMIMSFAPFDFDPKSFEDSLSLPEEEVVSTPLLPVIKSEPTKNPMPASASDPKQQDEANVAKWKRYQRLLTKS